MDKRGGILDITIQLLKTKVVYSEEKEHFYIPPNYTLDIVHFIGTRIKEDPETGTMTWTDSTGFLSSGFPLDSSLKVQNNQYYDVYSVLKADRFSNFDLTLQLVHLHPVEDFNAISHWMLKVISDFLKIESVQKTHNVQKKKNVRDVQNLSRLKSLEILDNLKLFEEKGKTARRAKREQFVQEQTAANLHLSGKKSGKKKKRKKKNKARTFLLERFLEMQES